MIIISLPMFPMHKIFTSVPVCSHNWGSIKIINVVEYKLGNMYVYKMCVCVYRLDLSLYLKSKDTFYGI